MTAANCLPIRSLSLAGLLMLGLALSSGCSGGDRPEVVRVSGTVLYNGDPIEGAQVAFRGDGSGRPAVATTDAQGRFRLSTHGEFDGAVPGEHIVTVSKVVAEDGGASASPSMEEVVERGPVQVQARSLIPERYADPTLSDLRRTVEKGQTNDFTLELTD